MLPLSPVSVPLHFFPLDFEQKSIPTQIRCGIYLTVSDLEQLVFVQATSHSCQLSQYDLEAGKKPSFSKSRDTIFLSSEPT